MAPYNWSTVLQGDAGLKSDFAWSRRHTTINYDLGARAKLFHMPPELGSVLDWVDDTFSSDRHLANCASGQPQKESTGLNFLADPMMFGASPVTELGLSTALGPKALPGEGLGGVRVCGYSSDELLSCLIAGRMLLAPVTRRQKHAELFWSRGPPGA